MVQTSFTRIFLAFNIFQQKIVKNIFSTDLIEKTFDWNKCVKCTTWLNFYNIISVVKSAKVN